MNNPLTMLIKGAGDSVFSVAAPGFAAFTVDVVDSETHDWKNDVTMYPVEDGADISDNIRPTPVELSMSCFVGGQPIKGYGEMFDDWASMSADRFLNGNRRLQECFQSLLALRDSRTLMTVATRYRTYSDMAITSVNLRRTPDDGDSLVFDITWRQCRIVSSQMTRVPDGMAGNPNSATGTAKQRSQGTTNAGPSKGTQISAKDAVEGKRVSPIVKLGEVFGYLK